MKRKTLFLNKKINLFILNYLIKGYLSQINSSGINKNGISIEAILIFPARNAIAIINTTDKALSRLPIKNVLGISSSMPTNIAEIPKTGIVHSAKPNWDIIFNDCGFFL